MDSVLDSKVNLNDYTQNITSINSSLNNKLNTGITTTGSGNAITSVTESNGNITLTKGSTFSLSDHNHDSTYLKLTGGSLTGNITIKNTDITRGTAPSAQKNRTIFFADTAGTVLNTVRAQYSTDNSSEISIRAFKTTEATGDNNIGRLGIGCNSSGTVYTVAPTPAQTDDSTNIATTAYVKDCVPKSIGNSNTPVYTDANGVITSTGKSFANYLPLSGGTITNCKEGYNSVSVSTSTASIDFSTKNFYFLTLSSATTLTFTNTLAAGNGALRIITLAIKSNGYSITWGTSVSWENGITPVLTTDKTDVFNFIEGISGIWGIFVGSF